ncbi:MAG: glutathione S-transferase N-terminal domain-containing protein [Deltaproteobacteria bacterium]|nr:glutathione S-transferase N-terminal domain-containing protein [Deltaproteobacteria bacterium]
MPSSPLARPSALLMTLTSPYARKCRMVALEKGVDLPCTVEPPHAQGSRVGALNPLVKVPTLLLEDGTSVYDSRVIVEYLELLWPDPPLVPREPRDRIDALRWQALGDGLADAMVLLFSEGLRPAERRDADWEARQRHKVRATLALLDGVARPDQYLVGGRLTLADLATAAGVGYVGLRGAELLAEGYPNLHAWLAWFHERPSVRDTAPPRS